MTSSIFTDWGEWDVRNWMFWRVLDLAVMVGEKRELTDQQKAWVQALKVLIENDDEGSPLQTYSPDVDVFEIISSREEAGFWSDVLMEVARRVFLREYGASQEVDVATETVWAAYDLALLLRKVAIRPRKSELS